MTKILVTGGCGYIGSHTIVNLLENGFAVISADSNIRSNAVIIDRVEMITGKKIKNYTTDLCNETETRKIFSENPDIKGIIHFAAFKTVDESVEKPLMYFHNNLTSLINILKCAEEFKILNFVFSSSCTVYGDPDIMPVTENTPFGVARSPYGMTKQMGEEIVSTTSRHSDMNAILLRYFNPVGAHSSGLIGELPIDKPSNLVPAITQTAIGKIPSFRIYGNDYPTRDGTCIRDYIHVSDIAHAHALAIQYLMNGEAKERCEVFNLGSGTGSTVLEVILAFEKVSGQKLNYFIGPRRSGDVIAVFANNNKAKKLLNWEPKNNLEEMMRSAWEWEKKLKEVPL